MTIDFATVLDWLLVIVAGVGVCLTIFFQLVFLRREHAQTEKKAASPVKLTLVRSSPDRHGLSDKR